ncbi:MAG TPA: hypothetical protein PKA00_14830 [Saprospiraceae bacterium]|nr:hypothetical protein [Saprospiraceae bacterium]
MHNNKSLLSLFLVILSLQACQSEYQRYVDEEVNSGITQDSLIFGMRMGQTKKDFFATCWELNRQKLISQGNGNTTARYIADQDSTGTNPMAKDMLFYGIFDENDIMRGMEMTYSFLTWAPWNRNKQSDSLMLHLRDQYLKGYPGNDFIELKIKALEHPALVKIDGNRQILMYPKNDKDVVVKIEDLNYKLNNEWKKE